MTLKLWLRYTYKEIVTQKILMFSLMFADQKYQGPCFVSLLVFVLDLAGAVNSRLPYFECVYICVYLKKLMQLYGYIVIYQSKGN